MRHLALTTLTLLLASSCAAPPEDRFSRGGDQPVDEAGTLSGRICAPSGDAVFGALVTASLGGTVVAETYSDESGAFLFEDLLGGTYTLSATKGSYSVTWTVDYLAGAQANVGDNCLDPSSVRIAVVTGFYDSIGDLIGSLGLSVDVWNAEGSEDYRGLLSDPTRLAEYDVIFFNCGMSESWGAEFGTVGANLDAYVRNGGSLYVSDLAFPILEAARPEFLDMAGDDSFEGPRIGEAATVQATVLDPVLTTFFGGRLVDIEYDLGGWAVVEGVGPDAEVIARATVPTAFGAIEDAPIVASMQLPGEGKMVYTTFHNEAQITADMEAILFELILAL
jgi:hypothetical protein